MSQLVVCDASALVALLLDPGPDGTWVTEALADAHLAAPALIGWETANIIRRLELAGIISADQAAQAHADFLDLTIERWPYELLSQRAWQLRLNLTIYDATYVAVAERLEAPLITLDRQIAGAPGIDCSVLSPSN